MGFQVFQGNNTQSGFKVGALFQIINNAVASAKLKLSGIAQNRSSVSIGDMFEMQMLMNHLSQLSEMTTNVVSASNQAINAAARQIKA